MNVSRCPNAHFDIQLVIDQFPELINSLFINNMVQQEYYENLKYLNLQKCDKLTSEDLIILIKQAGVHFDLETFLDEDNLPGKNSDLMTNDVVKAISESKPFIKRFIDENVKGPDREYFNFNIRKFRQVDYGINYLIEVNVAILTDYDDYIQHYSSFLTFESLQNILELAQDGNTEIISQMKNVSRLDLSQNKFIYNQRYIARIYDALDQWQSKYHLVL